MSIPTDKNKLETVNKVCADKIYANTKHLFNDLDNNKIQMHNLEALYLAALNGRKKNRRSELERLTKEIEQCKYQITYFENCIYDCYSKSMCDYFVTEIRNNVSDTADMMFNQRIIAALVATKKYSYFNTHPMDHTHTFDLDFYSNVTNTEKGYSIKFEIKCEPCGIINSIRMTGKTIDGICCIDGPTVRNDVYSRDRYGVKYYDLMVSTVSTSYTPKAFECLNMMHTYALKFVNKIHAAELFVPMCASNFVDKYSKII